MGEGGGTESENGKDRAKECRREGGVGKVRRRGRYKREKVGGRMESGKGMGEGKSEGDGVRDRGKVGWEEREGERAREREGGVGRVRRREIKVRKIERGFVCLVS